MSTCRTLLFVCLVLHSDVCSTVGSTGLRLQRPPKFQAGLFQMKKNKKLMSWAMLFWEAANSAPLLLRAVKRRMLGPSYVSITAQQKSFKSTYWLYGRFILSSTRPFTPHVLPYLCRTGSVSLNRCSAHTLYNKWFYLLSDGQENLRSRERGEHHKQAIGRLKAFIDSLRFSGMKTALKVL